MYICTSCSIHVHVYMLYQWHHYTTCVVDYTGIRSLLYTLFENGCRGLCVVHVVLCCKDFCSVRHVHVAMARLSGDSRVCSGTVCIHSVRVYMYMYTFTCVCTCFMSREQFCISVLGGIFFPFFLCFSIGWYAMHYKSLL